MSEYGFQSFPAMETIKRFTRPEDRSIDSEVMRVHQKHPRGNRLIKTYMARDYHIPKNFKHFLYVSQVLQAEGMKIGIEAHRRAKPFCMGTLYWQLNDCWPAISWSSIDYYGHWKAFYYFVKKAYKDLLVSPVEEKGKLKVYIVSEQLNPLKGVLLIQLMDLSGKGLWEKSIPCQVKPNSSQRFFEMDVKDLLEDYDKRNIVFKASFLQGKESLSSNLYYFVPPKDLLLTAPNIKSTIVNSEKGFTIIELSSEKLAKNVFLSIDEQKGFLSDNYFDLLPGEKVRVHFTVDRKVENLSKKLKIISLIDTLKNINR